MAKRNVFEIGLANADIEKLVISDYVRLCFCEGARPVEAFKRQDADFRSS